MTAPHPHTALADLWRSAGHGADALDAVELTGAEPVLPSSFAVGTMAQTTLAAGARAAAELWRLRSGRQQRVRVAMRDAAIEFRSERYLQVNGKPAPEYMDRIHGIYRCRDGRFVRIHANLPHHRDGVLKLLGCAHERAAVAKALAAWDAEAYEAASAEAGLVGTMSRSFAEWDAHPHGRVIPGLPLFTIERIGDAPARPLPGGDRPLAGIRVLDMTRVIAGPVCGRALASHGADVLLVTARHLPTMEPLVIDNGRGKLSTAIDLRTPEGRATLTGLLTEADIFVQGYRPGAIAGLGFGPQDAAAIRPGIICVSLCAYGHDGPWAGRRGFDSLVQNANGLNVAEAEAAGDATPKPLPAQVIDHGTGHLMAFAAMTALARRTLEGGSWHVRLSLAQTAHWLRSFGRVDGLALPDPDLGDVRDRLEEMDSGFGRITTVRHAAVMSETPPHWMRPSVPLGTDPPAWPR
jgi:crotonobetainyl-CoA:carnitine CoA-transferase CaiB-like acyl-CoA transferase